MNTFWRFFAIAFGLTAAWSIFRNPAEAGCAIILLLLFVIIVVGVLISMFIQHLALLVIALLVGWLVWRSKNGHSETPTAD